MTHHGCWKVRDGIIVRLEDEAGRVGLGEIAPLEWFGSESLAAALRFCQQLPDQSDCQQIAAIPANLPACRFGFASAWELLMVEFADIPDCPCQSQLLPSGAVAVQLLQSWQDGGDRTFKWKIGVASIREEMNWFEQLIAALPPNSKLRLDANGGLTEREASAWLEVCDAAHVEFLEQPLPPSQFETMLKLSDRHTTPIALDESVATVAQLRDCHRRGWRGIFVIKAPIAGFPSELREFCQDCNPDIVWSSVFETGIAQRFVQWLSAASPGNRAIGSTDHWFEDQFNQLDSEQLWQTLSPV